MLWTPYELEILTSGKWIRPPGQKWNPARVKMSGIRPDGRPVPLEPDTIMFIRTERGLSAYRDAGSFKAGQFAAGIAVHRQLSDSTLLPDNRPIIAVPDPEKAIRALALYARERMEGQVVAITGTVGKTTTRGMLLHIFKEQGRTITNAGNFNSGNNILSYMASTRRACRLAVFEVGIGGAVNALRQVSRLTRPDVVVLSQLGIAHLDSITRAPLDEEQALRVVAGQKAQLFEAMRSDGTAVINRDIPLFDEIAARIRKRGHRVVSYGLSERADYRFRSAGMDGALTKVVAEANGVPISYQLSAPGEFMAVNSLGAVAAAMALGLGLDDATGPLSTYTTAPGRAQLIPLTIAGKPITLINDSYNSTPLSVRSTLRLLQGMETANGARRIAILGDIAHLGADSARIHAGLAAAVTESNVDCVYTFGPKMEHLHRALPAQLGGGHFQDKNALFDAVLPTLSPGDVITIKASMPSRFAELIRMFRRAAQA